MPIWNPNWDSNTSTAAPTVAPTTIQTTERADNSTPLGRGIPLGVGTFGAKGEIVVDPDMLGGVRLVGGRYLVNLVLSFFDDSLGGTGSLVWLKANDEFVFRAQEPQRALSSPMRVYGGDQTTADSLITEYLPATDRTCWPGMGYIVLEDFDITDFSDNGEIPAFTAAWSTDATEVAASTSVSNLNFGTYSDDFEWSIWPDWNLGLVYRVMSSRATGIYTLSVTDIATEEEIRRVTITSPLATMSFFGPAVALPGTDYAIAYGLLFTSGFTLGGFMLLNVQTGVIVDIVGAVDDGTTEFYEASTILKPVMIRSDTATIFMALTEVEFIGPVPTENNLSFCLKIDVTNETITAVNDPVNNPVRGVGGTGLEWTYFTIASPAGVANGLAVFYAKEFNRNTILRVVVSESGVQSTTDVFTPGADAFLGIAYDAVRDAIVYSTSTQLVSIDLTTLAENYRVNTLLTNLHLGVMVELDNSLRPGYAMAYREAFGRGYLVDLGDGSFTEINDSPYSQYLGLWFEESNAIHGAVFFYRYGDLTPNVVDAVEILTALMTYQGRYASGDLVFSGFTGGECYGYSIQSDTTIDECVRDVCKTLGIREYHDKGKVNFVMPARDGSFAIDRVLTTNDITIDRIKQDISDQDASIKDCHLSYIDIDADFVDVTQSYQRPTGVYETTASSRVERPSTNLVMTAQQAIKQAWRMTYESEYERTSYNLPVAPRCFELVPSDTVSFPFGSRTVVGEVRRAGLATSGAQVLTVTQALQGAENTALGTSLIAPAITTETPSQMIILDTALLSLSDDLGGAGLRGYAAFVGVGAGALSASLGYKSTNGFDYLTFGSVSDVAPISGTVSSITRDTNNDFETDFGAALVISIASGDISTMASTNEAGRYSRENYAVVGAAGRWVIISYETVSTAGQVATLGNIIWGIQGTEVYLSQLAVGDRFINLERDEILTFSNPTLDATVYYKGGRSGLLVNQMTTIAKPADGEAEKPLAAVQIDYSDVSTTRTITWEPRERLSIMPVLYGSQSFGYSETSEAYEIDLLNGSTVLATLTATDPTVDYDTGTYAATGANIYQMGLSGALRGHAGTITF